MREPPDLRDWLREARERGVLVPLADLAEVRSGVVTRANAYFVVRELPLDEIPDRFRITERDYERMAVIEDGLKTLHRCERICLRPIVKGPEALVGPNKIMATDRVLFDVQDRSKDELRELRANGALQYIRRGETFEYNVSQDALKGGIPAQRSQIRNRKPYWYSLHAPSSDVARIAVPEHFDTRFIATLIPAGSNAVVIDTLYNILPFQQEYAQLLLASLNSLVTAYQLEMRGRTQHGEGVLKVKIADWQGLLVPSLSALGADRAGDLLEAFQPLGERRTLAMDGELAAADRVHFDTVYIASLGTDRPQETRVDLERELRGAVGERKERSKSVAEAKAGRAASQRVTASVDAYASRLAAALEVHPDPRTFVRSDDPASLVLVAQPFDGPLSVGDDLFSQGHVLAGEQRVAAAGGVRGAHYVRSVLLHDPELTAVAVPEGEALLRVTEEWEQEAALWKSRFEAASAKVLGAVDDERLRQEIRGRALQLLHER